MSSSRKFVIFLFETSHLAIGAELAVKPHFSTARLVPLPPEVSAGCGMVLRAEFADFESVKECLVKAGVPFEAVYELVVDGSKRSVVQIDTQINDSDSNTN